MKFNYYTLLLLLSLKLFSQTETTISFEAPNYGAKSPEAGAFLKYGEYPVNMATGVPNISIPLYTIDVKGYQVPITLDYHASGIKVSQEATWVGLGWNLNFGAQIILGVRDDVDENNPQSGNIPLDSSLEYYNNHPYDFTGGPIVSEQLSQSRVKDIYYFSSPTANGQFVIDGNDIVVYPPDAFKVSGDTRIDGQVVVAGAQFKITDASGNIYIFATKEISHRQFSHHDNYTSAWFVDKIITATKQHIDFVYQDDGVLVDYSVSHSVDIIENATNCGCPTSQGYVHNNQIGPLMSRGGSTNIYAKRISEIVFNNGKSKVKFLKSTGREDLRQGLFEGGPRLYSNSKLSSIEVQHLDSQNTFENIKTFNFEYAYFNPSATGSMPYNLKRLKLTGLSSGAEKHSFVYNNLTLPAKNSYAQDYYGYYNGATNNTNLIPKHTLTHPYATTVGNADRDVSESALKAGILTEIHYPTKGFTKFNYENNRYYGGMKTTSNPISLTGAANGVGPGGLNVIGVNESTYTSQCSGSSTCVRYYAIPLSTPGIGVSGQITVNIYNDSNGDIHTYQKKYGRVRVICDGDTYYDSGKTISLQHTQNVTVLGPGYVVIEAWGQGIHATANISYAIPVTGPSNPLAAGLRIGSIENYDSNNTIALRKEYSYTQPSDIQKSSGKLVNGMGMDFKTPLFKSFTAAGLCPGSSSTGSPSKIDYSFVYSITSEGNYGLDGNAVIYEYVKERNINVTDSTSNGYTLYKFTTESDWSPHPSIVIPTSWKRGKLLEKHIYKNVGTSSYLQQKTVNTYFEDHSKIAYVRGFKMQRLSSAPFIEDPAGPFILPLNMVGLDECGIPGNVNHSVIFHKYAMQAPWYYLKNTETTEYFYNPSNAPTGTLVTSKTFNYNNPNHLQLSSEVTTTSLGETLETRYFYPHDAELATEPVITSLIQQNIIDKPLKIQVFKNGEKLQEQKTVYKNWGNGLLLPEIIQTSKGTGPLEERLRFFTIDPVTANVIQLIDESLIPVIYIWGYNGLYPVAKVEGGNYFTISTTRINAIQTASSTGAETALIAALNDFRMNEQGFITTYTYKPLIGVTSITDPNNNTIRYYYDNYGRLKEVRDSSGNLLSEHQYHYMTP